MFAITRVSPNSKSAPTRRELLGYAQLIALLLLTVTFTAIAIRIAIPAAQWIDVGATDEFKSEVPVLRTITLHNASGLRVWIVHPGSRWLILDPHLPFGSRCLVQWQPVTNRFEDPCSGARFARTGEYLDVYTYLVGTRVQNLDQYLASVRSGHIFMDASHLIHAEPFIATAPNPECCPRVLRSGTVKPNP